MYFPLHGQTRGARVSSQYINYPSACCYWNMLGAGTFGCLYLISLWASVYVLSLFDWNLFHSTGRVCDWSCLKVSLWENVQMDCFKNQQVTWQNKAWRSFIHWHSWHCRIWNFPGKLIAMIVMLRRFAGSCCLLIQTSTYLITFYCLVSSRWTPLSSSVSTIPMKNCNSSSITPCSFWNR